MRTLFEFCDVSFSYRNLSGTSDNGFGLKKISLNIEEGDFITIIGKNGSGKSTLVKLISKILVNYKGDIVYDGREIHTIERKEYSRNVSYIPQSTIINEDITVTEFLLLGRYAHKKFTDFKDFDTDRDIVKHCIHETAISNLAGSRVSDLSGGEKQKVLLTLALVQLDITKDLSGKILVIDEPLTYLDVNYQFEIFNILNKLREKKLTIIIVIHDLNLALRYSDKTILMNSGQVIRFTDSRKVITEDMLKEYFLIESKIVNFEQNYFINYLPN